MTTQLPRSTKNSSSSSSVNPKSVDALLDQIARATSLQQSGKISEAAKIFKQIAEADPDGQLGDVARKSLESLDISAIPKAPPLERTPVRIVESESQPESEKRQFAQWFYDLPLRNKQLLGLFTSEVISILGLVGVGSILIVTGLRGQLIKQAGSELAVTGITYNIKINQMGFGFRGQSDNAAIIESAQTGVPSASTFQILRNEITARNIEYATLVDNQARIIASANANRRGEVFDPNGLVTQVLTNPEQIKTTETVSWEEIQKENPPLPEGFSNQDALIRYTVTPVRNPQTQAILGALVSGDIVNNKLPIATGTLDAFDGGYSAVYFRQDDGEFTLATSLYQRDELTVPNIELPTLELLTDAANVNGDIVNGRQTIESTPYTLAARAIPDSSGQPTAVLVRGTPESGVNQVLQGSFLTQFVLTFFVIAADILLAILLTRSVARPIQKLQKSAKKLASGDFKTRADVFSTDEVGQLAQSFNQMAQNIDVTNQERERVAELRQQESTFQREEKERLQRRVIDLLLEIEGAREGDLTIQARVTDDEMGSVADAFNATVQSLRELVLQVQSVAEQVNQSATQSNVSVGQLSESALDQSQTITHTLRSVESMTTSIQEVASSAMEAAQIAREASDAAAKGGDAMELTVESIEDLRNTVSEASKKVKRLTESSQEISKIVALISEVSAKTNLLAFNASIEAVRAGEHGQGFRIVADEVRRLAERVTEATKEIEQLVTGIQLETADVLTMMEKGTTQVVTGSQLVADTRKTLATLVSVSQNIDHLVQTISENTSSQTKASQEVSDTIKEVAEVAQQSSSESKVVSESLKQLVSVAEDLQNSISQFRMSDSSKE
ncbi:MAG: methyl-accepting chemotaxis protein [Cyanobacteria bacterium P01_A01_bin.37]